MEINNEIKEIIENNPITIATIKDLEVHLVIAAFAKIINNKILITNNYMKQTIKNVKENSNISISVYNKEWETNCKGYEIKGTANYFDSGKWIEKIKEIPENKGMPCNGAIVVEIKNIKKLA